MAWIDRRTSWCSKARWIYRPNPVLALLVQNLSTINRFEHIESEEPVDSITYSRDRAFVVFVRVPYSENTASHEAHPEQWTSIASALSEIEDMRQWTYNPLNGHATGLTGMRYVWRARNGSRACNKACSRARNYFISLSTSCRKMVNSIEDIFEVSQERE